jgi:NADH-quinone oxidoreductase subunit E
MNEKDVAGYLGMPPIAVHEVTTFYNMYNQKPVGRSSSTSAPTCPASCAAAPRRCEHLRKLGIGMGETTRRRPFTLQQASASVPVPTPR